MHINKIYCSNTGHTFIVVRFTGASISVSIRVRAVAYQEFSLLEAFVPQPFNVGIGIPVLAGGGFPIAITGKEATAVTTSSHMYSLFSI
jgi:hypothetical protein